MLREPGEHPRDPILRRRRRPPLDGPRRRHPFLSSLDPPSPAPLHNTTGPYVCAFGSTGPRDTLMDYHGKLI